MCYALCNSILVFSRLNWWKWISLWTIVSLCYHRAEISIDQSTGPDIIHFSHGGPYVKCGQTPLPFIFFGSLVGIGQVNSPNRLCEYGGPLWSGWGWSHIFWTCLGEPVVIFFRERSIFFPDINWGTFSGDFENCTEPTTHVFHCFSSHTHYKWYS